MKLSFKRLKDKISQFFQCLKIFLGTRKKVDRINNDSISNAKKYNKELTILLHGVGANYYMTMYPIIIWLKKRGIEIVSIGYNDRAEIEDSGADVKKQIDRVMEKAGLKKVNLIGISLGGLVARYYSEELGGKNKINKLITIYTPLKAVKNKFGLFLNSLVGGNPKNSNLVNEKLIGRFSVKKHLAVYSKDDGIIGRQYPYKDIPKYVKQIPVEGGHILVSFNLNAIKIVLDYLNEK